MSLRTVASVPTTWPRPLGIAGALTAAVGVRFVLERSAAAGFIAGLVFGVSLLVVALASGWRLERVTLVRLTTGVVGGAVLVAIPRLLDPGTTGFVGMRPEPWTMWVAVTVLVSWSEEMILRGALFDAVRAPGGDLVAVAVTSAAFALMHVPLYGWSVVPLDLAVGVWLGGLRLASGGVVAPAMAHLIADLATW